MQTNDKISIIITIFAFSVIFAIIFLLVSFNEEKDKVFMQKISDLEANFTKLNNTQNNLIKYIAERNEPFMKEVVKYANETNQRLEKLENHK